MTAPDEREVEAFVEMVRLGAVNSLFTRSEVLDICLSWSAIREERDRLLAELAPVRERRRLDDCIARVKPEGDACRMEMEFRERHRQADFLVCHESGGLIRAEYINPRWQMAAEFIGVLQRSASAEEDIPDAPR